MNTVSLETVKFMCRTMGLCYCAKNYQDAYREIVEERSSDTGVSLESRIVLVILYGLITGISLVGNSLVIITFAMDRSMRSVTNVFILSLAVTDLMVTLTCVPVNIGYIFSTFWIFGEFMCKFVPFLMTFSVACSSLTLCSIALDRYVAIVHPHKVKFLQNTKPAAILLIFIWAFSGLCSTANLVFYSVQEDPLCPGADVEKTYTCYWPDNKYKNPLDLWLTSVVLFIVPFVIMSGAYGMIGYQLWIRKPVGQNRNFIRNMDMKKSVIKMLLIVMFAFVFCWSPIIVLNAVLKTTENISLSRHTVYSMKLYFQCISMTSCCVNPVIYTFMNKKFREKFMAYLFCKNKRVSPATVSKMTQEEGARTLDNPRMSMGAILPRDR